MLSLGASFLFREASTSMAWAIILMMVKHCQGEAGQEGKLSAQQARSFSDRSFWESLRVVDVRAFGSWISAPKCLFFKDFEHPDRSFGSGYPREWPPPPPRMSAGCPSQKLPLWAEISFLIFVRNSVDGEHPDDHNHQDFPKSTAIQMGGVLQYKWEYWQHSPSTERRGTKSTAIRIGGVLQYKLEVYCDTFLRSSGADSLLIRRL